MHDIEPYWKWREEYISSEDEQSPFYGRTYDEFGYQQKVYNYFIHPQWDAFGSQTLYTKILYAQYELGYAVLEMIGEWNDCLYNDVMFFKREVVDELIEAGINKFIIIAENVLNFHGSDDSYYEEWYEDVRDEGGWICFLNTLDHVENEMKDVELQYFINFGATFNGVSWRPKKPHLLCLQVEAVLQGQTRALTE